MEDEGVEVVCSPSARNELRKILRYDYFLIYIHHDGLIADLHNLVDYVTAFLNYTKPVIYAITSDESVMATIDIAGLGMMPKPIRIDVLHKQILNAIDMLSANRSINDVSHLPGNYAIDATLREKIQKNEKFVLVYLDIDKFKPFTDYYGLYRANQLIAYLGKILNSAIAQYGSKKDFIGNVGGDDFVLILNDYDYAEDIGNEIINQFDSHIPQFYTQDDREKGYIEVLNRKGIKERFAFITLSVAMVSNENQHFDSTDEVYMKMMKAKEKAKKISGSVMLFDRSKS